MIREFLLYTRLNRALRTMLSNFAGWQSFSGFAGRAGRTAHTDRPGPANCGESAGCNGRSRRNTFDAGAEINGCNGLTA